MNTCLMNIWLTHRLPVLTSACTLVITLKVRAR
jgi:hypothetical protein